MRSSCYSRDGQSHVGICPEVNVQFFGDMFKDYDNKFVTKNSRNSREFSFNHFDLKFVFKDFLKKRKAICTKHKFNQQAISCYCKAVSYLQD